MVVLNKVCPKCKCEDLYIAEDHWTDMISAHIECQDCVMYLRPYQLGVNATWSDMVTKWNWLCEDIKNVYQFELELATEDFKRSLESLESARKKLAEKLEQMEKSDEE